MKRIFFLMMAVWLMAGWVLAQDRPSEQDMFGGSVTTATPVATPETSSEDAMAGKPHNLLTSAEENTQIGGTLSTEADYYLQNGSALDQNIVNNPNILFRYLDSKLENDNRVFARIRAFYNLTTRTRIGRYFLWILRG